MPKATGLRKLRGGLLAGLLAITGSRAGHTAEIVLRLKEGGFEIAGTLSAFDGRIYRIETDAYGMLDLDASRFDCTGVNCNRTDVTPVPSPSPSPALATDQPARIAIHGSTSIGTDLMPLLIRAYAATTQTALTQMKGADPGAVAYTLETPDGREFARFDLQRRGSDSAFDALSGGDAAIGMSDRAISDAEVQRLAAVAPQIRTARHEHVLGLDGIVAVVSPKSAATALGLDAVARIFSGTIKDWSELGLPPGRIVVYAASRETATFSLVDNLLLKPRRLALTPDAVILGTPGEISEAVAQDPAGIGMVPLALAEPAKSLALQSPCGIPAAPTAFALKSGEYPLSQRLYLYTTPRLEQPRARDFLQFALSEAAQSAIAASPFVSQTPELAGAQSQTVRMALAARQPIALADAAQMRRLAADAKGARRLSVTFRFAPSSAELDEKSRQDVVRLSRHLSNPEFRGKTVLLLGFTDAIGSIPTNTALSLVRASQVRAALLGSTGRGLDAQRIAARGYGALAPVACNDTADGLLLNRRVEVWIGD